MSREKYDSKRLSDEIEELNVANLKKAYKRYKKDTRRFRNKNVRDVLDHIDFEVNLENELVGIKSQIECGDYNPHRPLIHDAPKSKGISRPVVSLRIEDVIVYRFCIEQIDEQIIKITRRKNIRGGVMASPLEEPEDGEFYEKWFKDWFAHNKAIHDALRKRKYTHIATTDISSYFDNVEINVLTELLRTELAEKPNLISLLHFFLMSVQIRYGYKTTLNTGLVQDDSDASRILAYFYLHVHDLRMIKFAEEYDALFFRFVDDMNVVVKSETEAKIALRTLTNSLRKLGLMASIEKTQINTSEAGIQKMFWDENVYLEDLDRRIKEKMYKSLPRTGLRIELKKYYTALKIKYIDDKNPTVPSKLLRRTYTLAINLQTDFLLDELEEHLLYEPDLIVKKKIQRYIIANQNSNKIDDAIGHICDYLEKPENLYPQAETELLEILACLQLDKLTAVNQVRIVDICHRLVFPHPKRPLESQSQFSKGIAAFVLHMEDPATSPAIADLYLSDPLLPSYFKKCAAVIGLCSSNRGKRKEVLKNLHRETSTDMKRLLYLIENLKSLKNGKVIKNYKKDTKFFLVKAEIQNGDDKQTRDIKLPYNPIRIRLLKQMISIWG